MSCVINVFILCSCLRSIKNRDEEQNGTESDDKIDGEIELKFRDV